MPPPVSSKLPDTYYFSLWHFILRIAHLVVAGRGQSSPLHNLTRGVLRAAREEGEGKANEAASNRFSLARLARRQYGNKFNV